MAFCSLPCWTYFSAVARTFCLLNPNNAIRVRTPDPGLDTAAPIQNPLNVRETCPRRCPEGHPAYWRTDRPDKANCTSGSHEPHGYQGLPKGSVRTGYQGNCSK